MYSKNIFDESLNGFVNALTGISAKSVEIERYQARFHKLFDRLGCKREFFGEPNATVS